jgi:hypothetical protein
MKLAEWIDGQVTKHGSRHGVHCWMADRLAELGTPITRGTIYNVDRGMKLQHYDRAKALSDLTRGAVSVAELCE